ncbi:prepilin peptidase [Bordetella genomosp. 7]|uniref:Prepilin peptidase n=1 Tax=Bordetella genomosp. 7 TaxID=1416805 RepID=A0A261QZ77_9BORD|nr:A24 family peptidase [Bordetella genomosp. 7]OZI17827.1 prepilin peptidase [Bordetella genomosp. 7]
MYLGESLWWLLFVLWNVLLMAADWRHRRVPNVLVVAAVCFQVLWSIAASVAPGWAYPPLWPGWGWAIAGFLAALAFLPLWTRRIMGAGDVKVIAAYGLVFGLKYLCWVLAAGTLLAGLHAAIYLAVSRWRALPQRLRQVPYATYLALGALSVAPMLWSSR